jgi:hypothetical protein
VATSTLASISLAVAAWVALAKKAPRINVKHAADNAAVQNRLLTSIDSIFITFDLLYKV